MVKPDVSKAPPPPPANNLNGGMVQCSKLVPKTAAAELSTIKDESLLKVVSTILDQDEPEDESSDEEFDELQLSSSLHNHSGPIGQPLDAGLVDLPRLLNKTLSELSPKKEIKLTTPHLIANKQGMLYNILIKAVLKLY
jgi:hypothetical protein